MARLDTIHRYALKGFSPETLDGCSLTADRVVPGDRAYALARQGAPFDVSAPAHMKKKFTLMLAFYPELARVKTRLIDGDKLEVSLPSGQSFTLDLPPETARVSVDPGLCHELCALASLEPETLDLVHASDQALTDIPDPHLSIINLDSVKTLETACGLPVDPVRFRGNLLVSGMEAWSELEAVGQVWQVGSAELEIMARIRRCPATSVHPDTAQRDIDMPALLMQTRGHMDCGVYARVKTPGLIEPGADISRVM